ncbi:MAG: hypothetical protein ACLR0U_15890 [Enterocloster clostridioformis]
MQQEQLKAELWDYVDSLPGQQPAVSGCASQDGMAMEAIGREYGTSGRLYAIYRPRPCGNCVNPVQ